MASVHLRLKELPASERPRERLLSDGPGRLSDAELVAILLRTGTARHTAVQVAQRLLLAGQERDGHPLRFLARAAPEDLAAMTGIGPAKAAQLLAAVELGRRLAAVRSARLQIKCAGDAAGLVMEAMRHLDREQFQVILLDTKNQVLGVETVFVGSLNTSIVHPREIFKIAVRRSANAVILVHNHPSGDPTPSAEDREVTRRLVAAGQLLGIPVLDHIVIGDGRFCSLCGRDRGLVAARP